MRKARTGSWREERTTPVQGGLVPANHVVRVPHALGVGRSCWLLMHMASNLSVCHFVHMVEDDFSRKGERYWGFPLIAPFYRPCCEKGGTGRATAIHRRPVATGGRGVPGAVFRGSLVDERAVGESSWYDAGGAALASLAAKVGDKRVKLMPRRRVMVTSLASMRPPISVLAVASVHKILWMFYPLISQYAAEIVRIP